MRLRRETGDFQIKVIVNSETSAITANTIQKNLLDEDLVGQIVDANGAWEVITKVTNSTTTITAVTESYTLTYTKATGAITAVANETSAASSDGD